MNRRCAFPNTWKYSVLVPQGADSWQDLSRVYVILRGEAHQLSHLVCLLWQALICYLCSGMLSSVPVAKETIVHTDGHMNNPVQKRTWSCLLNSQELSWFSHPSSKANHTVGWILKLPFSKSSFNRERLPPMESYLFWWRRASSGEEKLSLLVKASNRIQSNTFFLFGSKIWSCMNWIDAIHTHCMVAQLSEIETNKLFIIVQKR